MYLKMSIYNNKKLQTIFYYQFVTSFFFLNSIDFSRKGTVVGHGPYAPPLKATIEFQIKIGTL